MNKLIKTLAGCATLLGLAAISTNAFAADGSVSGYIKFWQNNGNYCDDSLNCDGSKYPESQFDTRQPIKNVKVYARRRSDNAIIGSGTTSTTGYFRFHWTDTSTSGNVNAEIIWRGEHKDGHFRLANTGGGHWIFWSRKTLNNASNTYVGQLTWGSSSSPHGLANVYDGASKVWENSLRQSNRMNAHFTNVQVRTWASATNASGKTANIQSSVAYNNHQAVMHELGHVASYVASRDQNYRWGGDYCYPRTGNCTWGRHSPEWAAARFEEAVATHFATVGLYHPSARDPHYCPSSGPCTAAQDNLEDWVSCSATANVDDRHPHDAMRYFWDTYDASLGREIWHIADTIHAFDNGRADNQKDEPWSRSWYGSWSIDDRDGRSVRDFVENWNTWGTSSASLLSFNCGDQGD